MRRGNNVRLPCILHRYVADPMLVPTHSIIVIAVAPKNSDSHADSMRTRGRAGFLWALKNTAEVDNEAGSEHNAGGLAMEEFGDELPVLTLWRIVEQVHKQLHDVEPPQLLEVVKERFAEQFPGTPFPWNEPFVLEVWQQYKDNANA
jgi:hypothetical protein